VLSKGRGSDSRLSYFKETLNGISRSIYNMPASNPIILSNSPVRRWPVFTTGKQNVKRELDLLWDKVERALLVSATLSIPTGRTDGVASREHIYNILNIPSHRGTALPPVTPEWVTKTPLFHIPPDKPDFCYPSQADIDSGKEGAKAKWHQAIAHEIASKPAVTAVGGTLVLLTSYEDVNEIGSILTSLFGDRILLKTPTSSLEKQKNEFKSMARAGMRPIWLAVGNAWTGLDLRDELVPDEEAEKDIILTDLVIPRINFADNQSLSHLLRQRANRAAGVTEAAFTLRQGLGRLIRRPGLVDRHIWFLDNRINHRGKQYNVFRNIVAVYRTEAG